MLTLPSGIAAAQPVLQPSAALDGPSSAIGTLTGLSMAPDGSGGLVYLKNDSGIEHVFVSRLTAGRFGPPEEVDAALGADSSQAVIAAGDNGLLLIAFVNANQLYVVVRPSASAPYAAPQPLADGASNPAIALSIHDKGYLAFVVGGEGGHDVRAAYYDAGQWAVEPSPLDAVPADDAGVGPGPPRVAAAGDGEGIIVWGEAGHVYSRRMWAASPSVVYEQADVPTLAGSNEISAGSPAVGVGDDSSFADIALDEQFSTPSGPQSRVLMRRLRGSRYERAMAADGLATTDDNAIQPQLAQTGADHGLITSGRSSSNEVFEAQLGDGGLVSSVRRADTLSGVTAPYAIPATAGRYSGLIAWQHDPGAIGPAEIRARLYNGASLGPDTPVSSPALGPSTAAAGLFAAGDAAGDLAVAWVQGGGGQAAIVAAQLYAAPGSFGFVRSFTYFARPRLALRWSASREQWGPVEYIVSIDGSPLAQTAGTSLRVPQPLADGPHIVRVNAVNQAGVSTIRANSIWIDTLAPSAQVTLTGRERVGSTLELKVRYTDPPPAGAKRAGSGVARVIVNWGDGAISRVIHRALHAYRRGGNYLVSVTVADRAGNADKLTRHVRIVA